MQIEILTKQDLETFRKELLHDLTDIISKQSSESQKLWLRSKEVRNLLGGISNGTLQNLRINGKLTARKLQGIYYYKLSQVKELLDAGTE